MLVAGRASADDLVFADSATTCTIAWRPGDRLLRYVNPRVQRRGLVSLDHWFQVAPGGRALGVWSSSSGLYVVNSAGTLLWHRDGVLGAFRFSPQGDRLAIASAKGIEIVSLDRREARSLTQLTGVDWMRWMDAGLLVQAHRKLAIVDKAGVRRTLATLPPTAVVAASSKRIVYFAPAALVDLDVETGRPIAQIKLTEHDRVKNAELSSDGMRILFGTDRNVFLMEAASQPRKIADVRSLRSLFFSPDGSSFLWADGFDGGGVVVGGMRQNLPSGVIAARFRQDGGTDLVLTAKDGITTWNPVSGARAIVGGIAPDDGVNIGGDLIGAAAVAFFYQKSGWEKMHQIPTTDDQF